MKLKKKKKFENEKPDKFIELDENQNQKLNENEKKKISEVGKKIQENIINYLDEIIKKIKNYNYKNDLNKLEKNKIHWKQSLKKKTLNLKMSEIKEFLDNVQTNINEQLKNFLKQLYTLLDSKLNNLKFENKN